MAVRAPGDTTDLRHAGGTARAGGKTRSPRGGEICSTCTHFADCVHRPAQDAPILFCEMYEEGLWSIDLVGAIIDRDLGRRGGLISMLEGIQAKYGYLPQGALEVVAERTGRSMVDIYGVATFYKAFSLQPRGKHVCSVCQGTACHVRGASEVYEQVATELGVRAGETTDDGEITLETVSCLGACALGPIVVVDGHYFSNVGRAEVTDIIERTRVGLDFVGPDGDRRIFPVEVYCARCNHSLMDPRHPLEGHPSVRVTISFGRQHGWLRLSSLYGSYTIESEHEIPEDTVANLFCPHCHGELAGATDCPLCGARMVPLIVRGGGMIQICSRRGCRSHMLDLDGVNL